MTAPSSPLEPVSGGNVSPSWRPTPKVAATGVSAAGALVLVWLLGLFHVELPPEVAGAIVALAAAAAGYLKKP